MIRIKNRVNIWFTNKSSWILLNLVIQHLIVGTYIFKINHSTVPVSQIDLLKNTTKNICLYLGGLDNH